jgi:RNA polymerase sigma-70 factor (ECF subfamily)
MGVHPLELKMSIEGGGWLWLRGPSLVDEAQSPAQSARVALPASETRKKGALEFEEVYRAFFGHVCRWVRALGGPDSDREDLVQDVFVIVHRRLPDFDGRNVHAWLYQITRHRVRDFRRLRWFQMILRSGSFSEVGESIVTSRTPERVHEDKEHAAVLQQLLSKLPEAQRAAFVLFEIDGYSGEEIATLQGVPLNTVWARIHKARAKLAEGVARFQRKNERGRNST